MANPDEHPDVAKVLAIEDDEERARLATSMISEQQQATNELSRIRRESVENMWSRRGMSYTEIGISLKMHPTRVSQLIKKGPQPERVVLGTGELAVALGGKMEGDKSKPGPVVAQDDLHAYDLLREGAGALGLTAHYEVVQPPGTIDINRRNLAVICGPRLSPTVAEVLEHDPHHGFAKADRWYLHEKETAGRRWDSPIDADPPRNEDYAYLGRLPRADGRGTFLYGAGIHAPGCAGAVHYLVSHLEEIHKTAPERNPWSMLVWCQFDADRKITSSAAVTDVRRWR